MEHYNDTFRMLWENPSPHPCFGTFLSVSADLFRIRSQHTIREGHMRYSVDDSSGRNVHFVSDTLQVLAVSRSTLSRKKSHRNTRIHISAKTWVIWKRTYGEQPSKLDLHMKARTPADASWTEICWDNFQYVENIYKLFSAECDGRSTSHALRFGCGAHVVFQQRAKRNQTQHISSTFTAHLFSRPMLFAVV